MNINELRLQCVKTAYEVMGPHPANTYVAANKKTFASDVLEQAKIIFEWVNGEILPSKMPVQDIKLDSLVGIGKVASEVVSKTVGDVGVRSPGPHGKP